MIGRDALPHMAACGAVISSSRCGRSYQLSAELGEPQLCAWRAGKSRPRRLFAPTNQRDVGTCIALANSCVVQHIAQSPPVAPSSKDGDASRTRGNGDANEPVAAPASAQQQAEVISLLMDEIKLLKASQAPAASPMASPPPLPPPPPPPLMREIDELVPLGVLYGDQSAVHAMAADTNVDPAPAPAAGQEPEDGSLLMLLGMALLASALACYCRRRREEETQDGSSDEELEEDDSASECRRKPKRRASPSKSSRRQGQYAAVELDVSVPNHIGLD